MVHNLWAIKYGVVLLIYLTRKKLTNDKRFFCEFCDYKCHTNYLLRDHYKKIHERANMKRPYSHAGQIQSENFEIEDVSSQIEENVKSEKPEDELEDIVPFEETPISNAAETESQTPNKEKTKFSLKGLLNKSNVKIVTSIKIFKCGICNQEWVTKGFLLK